MSNNKYLNDSNYLAKYNFPWETLNGKKILITGGSGLIGSLIVDVLMKRNIEYNNNIGVIILSRDEEKIQEKFSKYLDDKNFKYILHDINLPLENVDYDYIIHAASNTHPNAYATDPIGTITTNVIGTYNLLKNASKDLKKFILLSSVEIYGQNRGDIDKFTEDYCGYIDCNTLRAGYPESKRVSESLCQAFIQQKNLNISIARLSRVYGPTSENDSKASAQFIRNAVHNEDIILKSEGNQIYSYIYYTDAVSGIFHVLFYGKSGVAYNIANDDNGISLLEFAKIVASKSNSKVIQKLPNNVESKGFSVVTKATMDIEKIKKLGWTQQTSMSEGIDKTIKYLKNTLN